MRTRCLTFSLMLLALGCSRTSTKQLDSAPTKSNSQTSVESTGNANASKDPAVATDQAISTVRFATYNVSLFRDREGELLADLSAGKDQQAHKLATVIQHINPDVLLLNEFDFEATGKAADAFCDHYLGVEHTVDELTTSAVNYPYRYFSESNTGIPSGLDFNNDKKADGPQDCFGFGRYAGQYGMLVLSKYPIRADLVRTFQKFLWKDMPNAQQPVDPSTGQPYYSDDAWNQFRLSSKSHWDVPVDVDGRLIHFLVCHPTPPVFDGPEDRNGKRNHDEIRLFADYIDAERSAYVVDDEGKPGGIAESVHFVIAGDLNADPFDGDSSDHAARLLVEHPLIRATPIPASSQAAKLGERWCQCESSRKRRKRHGRFR